MKHLKKFLLAAVAMIMALAVVTPAIAAPASGTITINPPDNATGENTYKIYKVFDATVNENGKVAYKLLEGLEDTDVPAGFTAKNGYITEAPATLDEEATALAEYSKKELVDTVTTTGTTAATSKALDPGYYYIETSTGTAVYVDDGANVTIDDKNVISTVVKSAGTQYDANAMAAIAAVGTDQPFTAVITKGKGATNMVFADTMTNMTFNEDSLEIVATGITSDDYTVVLTDNGFTVTFDNDYIDNLADSSTITLHYTARVTSEALSIDPATNTASVTTGNDANPSNTVKTDDVLVYNAQVTVNKVDGENAPLAGAKFKLKNADGLYYAGATTDGTANWTENGVEVEAAAVTANGVTTYVANFVGLGIGSYTLEESTVPGGYNKADDVTITVTDQITTANLNQSETVINNSGATLPSTGGMGTTMFYVIGGILVAGAAIALVVKNRVAKIEE